MSVPSTPAQGDSAAKAVGPDADLEAVTDAAVTKAAGNAEAVPPKATPEAAGTDTAGSAEAATNDAVPSKAVPSAATTEQTEQAEEQAEDSSQENMAHEYVDHYMPNPVDSESSPHAADALSAAADISSSTTVTHSTASPDDSLAASLDGLSANSTGGSSPDHIDDSAVGAPPPPPTGNGGPAAPYEDPSLVPQLSPSAPPATSKGTSSGTSNPTGSAGSGAVSDAPPEAKAMSLMDHLGELRTRLVRAAIAVALAFAATYSVSDLIFAQLMRPLLAALPPNSKLIFTALPEAFFVYLQVGFVAAIFLASPYIFYQIWGFIAPGLYEEEKKLAVPMALCSAFFFILGATFCFLVVFPFSFTFFVGFATDDIIPMPSLSEYLGFALKMLIAFGLIFEMPLFTFFLARMGLVTAAMMRKVRRYAVLVIFIVAAILTPPDVMSQMLMAIPMLLLYELSIFIAVAFGKKPKSDSESAHADNASAAKEAADAKAPQAAASTSADSATTAP